MALTPSEEALVRQLLDQQAAILSLAGNESTITSKLGATKVTLSDLLAASAVGNSDLLLIRQGAADKSISGEVLKTTVSSFSQPGPNETERSLVNKAREIISEFDFEDTSSAQAGALNVLSSKFFSNETPRPNIRRLPDRLFIGDGAASSGAESQTANETWLFEQFGAYWFERGAELLSLPQADGYIGGMFASRTSTANAAGSVSIGMASVGWNDDPSGTMYSYAGYFEASREAGAGITYALEIAGKNKGDNHIRNPYAKDSGGVLGAWFAGGGDPAYNGSPANPNNTAIAIGKNSSTWNTGICFDADGITGTDGVTGTGAAMKMAKGHRLDWFCDSANIGAQILSTVSAGAGKTRIININDGGIYFGNTVSGSLFNFDISTTAANGFQFSGTNAGSNQTVISTTGSDANIDLWFIPKGSGLLKFGTYTGTVLTPTGYISIKDIGGTVRRLLVG